MRNEDAPAMPIQEFEGGEVPETGLTKREHFAGLAMQGNMASRNVQWSEVDTGYMASMAVEMADALLAELEKSQ